jgi:Domain of Unknown Function (DUF1080)
MRLLSLLALLALVAPASAQWKLDAKFQAAKPEDLKDHPGTPAPKDAIILFDGKTADAWTKRDGKKVEWKIADGAMEGFKGHGDIVTKEKFDGKFLLHVEFRIPYEPELKQGQGRGNSGVYVQGRYEVQVLDSYGIESKNNDCAAIYEVAAPLKNVCKAPTVWQSYDIEFTSPKFEDGKKVEPVHITVTHNGVKVHDDLKVNVDNTRAGAGGDVSKPGPILLQDHGHAVQYRNIWLVKR